MELERLSDLVKGAVLIVAGVWLYLAVDRWNLPERWRDAMKPWLEQERHIFGTKIFFIPIVRLIGMASVVGGIAVIVSAFG